MKSLVLLIFFILPYTSSKTTARQTLDTDQSSIFWKGTKMRGLGKHEGAIHIREGYIEMNEGVLSGGKISIDMNSIRITDIPAHERIPIRNLTNHLKSDDFFAVKEYPTATFEITHIKPAQGNSVLVTGMLSIRDVSRPIEVLLNIEQTDQVIQKVTTEFTFDRFEWNIGYTGSWVERTFVDATVRMRVELLFK